MRIYAENKNVKVLSLAYYCRKQYQEKNWISPLLLGSQAVLDKFNFLAPLLPHLWNVNPVGRLLVGSGDSETLCRTAEIDSLLPVVMYVAL